MENEKVESDFWAEYPKLWRALDGSESIVRNIRRDHRKDDHRLFELAYSCAMAPPHFKNGVIDVANWEGALFHARTMNDFRGVVKLVVDGYAQQAACVAAALYENALFACCLFGDSESRKRYASGKIPGASDLTKKHIQINERLRGKEADLRYRELYSHYKWLCQLKHPTKSAASHSASGTKVADGVYVIMAFPRSINDDASMQDTVLMCSILRLLDSAFAFAKSTRIPESDPQFKKMEELRSECYGLMKAMVMGNAPLPVSLSGSKFSEEYRNLRDG